MTEPAPPWPETRRLVGESALDIVDVGIVACDPHGRLTMFNRASREFHGADADSSVEPAAFPVAFDLYDTDGELLHPDQVPLVRALRDGTVDAAHMVIAP